MSLSPIRPYDPHEKALRVKREAARTFAAQSGVGSPAEALAGDLPADAVGGAASGGTRTAAGSNYGNWRPSLPSEQTGDKDGGADVEILPP